MNTLENLYYGNIDPHEHTVSNGTDKGEFLETVVRLETELRATLTEQQKALFEQIKKRMQKLRPEWATSVHKRISICIAADDGSVRADTWIITVTK